MEGDVVGNRIRRHAHHLMTKDHSASPQLVFPSRAQMELIAKENAAALQLEKAHGSKWYAIFVCVFASLGGIFFGYDQGATGGVLVMPSFLAQLCVGFDGNSYEQCTASSLDLPHNWINFTTTYMLLYYVGCMIGAYVGGVVADKRGRRAAIFTAGFFYCSGTCLLIFTGEGNHALALIARVIQGIGVGNSSFSLPLFGAEMAPKELRGMLSGFMSMSVATGTLMAGLIGYRLQDMADGWRMTVSLAIAFPVILMVGTFFIPESPRWVYQHQGYDAAERTLTRLRRTDNVGDELKAMGEVLDQVEPTKATWKDVFDSTVRFHCDGIASSSANDGDINPLGRGAQIFKGILGNGIGTLLIFQAMGFICTIPTLYLVDKAGRRTLLLVGGLGMMLGHLTSGISLSLGCHDNLERLNWGPITWIYPAEIFPLKSPCSRCVAVDICQLGHGCYHDRRPDIVSLLAHARRLLCLCAGIFVYVLCPETKNVALEEIELLFSMKQHTLAVDMTIASPADDKF
ncbi:hypothetical protein AC1031_007997 [Aphanomyces cochlioides]|nr:hypothetical protein AC1031_007997 [Aphanomyces cochlioides]